MTHMYPPISDEWAYQLAIEAFPTERPEKILQHGLAWGQHAVMVTTLNYDDQMEWNPEGEYPDKMSRVEEVVRLDEYFDAINDEVTIMGYGYKSKTLVVGYRPQYDDGINRMKCGVTKVINANLR